jgi:uncharacterized membrane protein
MPKLAMSTLTLFGFTLSSLIKIARGLGVMAIIVIYALLVHHVNITGQSSTLGAALALIPIFMVVMAFSLKTKSRFIGISVLLIFIIASWLLWPFVKQHTGFVFWLLDIGLMLALLMTFAQTLFAGRKPLCVFFAEIINGGTLPPDHEIYARNVTVAWVVFFAVIIVISTVLFFMAPLAIWSFFVNFLTLPLVALMFAGEYLVRRYVLSDLPTGDVLAAVRVYIQNSKHAK